MATDASAQTESVAEEKRVGSAELFFDLVFVFAVTQISSLITSDHHLGALARALIVFVPIYWTWVGAAVQTNLRDMSRPSSQLLLLVIGAGGFGMALTVNEAFGANGFAFALFYWCARTATGLQMLRAFGQTGVQWNPVSTSIFVTGPMLVIGGLLDGDARVWVWLLAAAIDLATPTLFKGRLRAMRFDSAHLVERFGCFVLIALGETVVAIGLPAAEAEHLSIEAIGAIAAAFAVVAGLFWVYFFYASDAMRHALSIAQVQLDVTRHVLSYGHLLFIASIIAVASGMHATIAHPQESLEAGVAALMYGGCALYLATFTYTRWEMFRKVSTTRLVAAALVALLIPVATLVTAVVALAALAVVVIGLNVTEYTIVQRRTAASTV